MNKLPMETTFFSVKKTVYEVLSMMEAAYLVLKGLLPPCQNNENALGIMAAYSLDSPLSIVFQRIFS
jgi:hypothetical protein